MFKSRGWPFYVLVTNLSNVSAGSTDPSTVFSTLDWDHLAKICQHSWTECVKISKVVNFDSDEFNTNEEITPQFQRWRILKCLYGGLQICAINHTNVCKISNFVKQYVLCRWTCHL